ncbi:MAG: PepSY-like domain-containing protein [Gemmatimonadales bacterium]|nr:PepSY-like domain-containing protein [Gemmatimonadales bacterium]
MRTTLATLTLATLLGHATTASAQERKVTNATLPPAVRQAVTANSEGATIKGYSREREHGRTLYEAEMTVDGHTKDVLFDATGKVVEVEEQVELSALPAAVQSALEAGAGKAKITKIESLTKAGKLVAYEAQLTSGRKHSEIQVGPGGERLSHEE